MPELPTDIFLEIWSRLNLSTLSAVQRVSRQWNAAFEQHKDSIYHRAAHLHGWIPSESLDFNALPELYSSRSLRNVCDWETFCRKRVAIDSSWAGAGPSSCSEHIATGRTVHRFKVDEKAGYIICSSRAGGLRVLDMNDDTTLWTLPHRIDVRPYAHCEYAEGFLIFDRDGSDKEVWRRTADVPHGLRSPTQSSSNNIVSLDSGGNAMPADARISQCLPDEKMWRAWHRAQASSIDPKFRGHFTPWLRLRAPEFTRAYRLVYPTLLVAALNKLYLFNVHTGELVQTIAHIQRGGQPTPSQAAEEGEASEGEEQEDLHLGIQPLGDLNYVELSHTHAFVCGASALRVFSRATGRMVLSTPSTLVTYGRWKYTMCSGYDATDVHPGSVMMKHRTECQEQSLQSAHEYDLRDQFVAIHVSPCGKNLVALLRSSRVVVIYDFQRSIAGECALHDISMEVGLGSRHYQSVYLAFENDRVAAVTGSGIFVFPGTRLEPSIPAAPALDIQRVRPLRYSFRALQAVSCLMLSDTGLWVTFVPAAVRSGRDVENDDACFMETLQLANQYPDLEQNGVHYIPSVDIHNMLAGDNTVYSIDFVEA